MKNFAIILYVLMTLTACTSKKQAENNEPAASKSLVLYYSQTNTTKQVAEAIQQLTGADIEAFDAATPYTGDFNATIARCQEEMANGTAPEINALKSNIAAYDTIFLGYPVWFGTCAMPVSGLLKTVDLSGKVIVPFCTFGSGGLNTSINDLKTALPNANILPGYGVRQARIAAAKAEVNEFLIRSGIIAGEAETLADFSEQQAVTDEDKAIFDSACSGYSMPLGTPVSCGKRVRQSGTEYLFIAESAGRDGSTSNVEIYVINDNEGKAEFTQVVR